MSRYKRPMPDDFAEVSAKQSVKAMRSHYIAGERTITRWLAEIGKSRGGPPRSMPVPDDYAELAAKYHAEHLKRHYDVSGNVIERWTRDSGIKPVSGVKRAPPADFAQVAPTMTRSAMMGHYKADIRTITRWCEETGVQARQWANNTPPPPRSWRPNMSPTRSRVDYGLSITRTISIYDQAADTLRRERWAVYRCTEKGRQDEAGTFWRVGNVVCTPAELLERAARAERRAT